MRKYKDMKTIIPPIDKQLLEAELSNDRFLRKTNNGNKKCSKSYANNIS